MRSTLKPYFLADCCKGERCCTCRTTSENLQKYAKKTVLRLDWFKSLMAKNAFFFAEFLTLRYLTIPYRHISALPVIKYNEVKYER